jgi:hypothetical protein
MTLSEIQAAHPKCVRPDGKPWCKHYMWMHTHVCELAMAISDDPSKDYCMMHTDFDQPQTEEEL